MEDRMERNQIRGIIRNLNYSLSDAEVDLKTDEIIRKIRSGDYDFSSYTKRILTQQGKKRVVYCYSKLSVENVLCQYLKKQVDSKFRIHYASRNKIINILFNVLPVIRDMNDFVIIRVDFKSFFESVLSEHVYSKYIEESMMRRSEKEILERYISQFKYCYAGLCLSNGLAEIVCRDFDAIIKAHLSRYGLFFYERYVDDILLITNKYISQAQFYKIINEVIIEVFGKCPVKLSKTPGKYAYISKRNLSAKQQFCFLGYEFEILETIGKKSKKQIEFRYGISEKKRRRYRGIIERAFVQYKKDGNLELLRQRLKIFSSRVVIAKTVGSSSFDWLTKGLVANYNELRFHMDSLQQDTKIFLKDIYFDLFKQYGCSIPYFMKQSTYEDSIYSVISTMKRNRSIVFEKNIGVSESTLLKWILRLNPSYNSNKKDYYRIVVDYLEMIKVE